MTARELLEANWVETPAAGYTRPTTDGLYPHQWNWDSAFAALGWAALDPRRAWAELTSLAGMQGEDGSVPHLAYSAAPQLYFPSADWWPPRWGRDGRRISGISQPPVFATCLRLILERHGDDHHDAARPLLTPLLRWHEWWLRDGGPVVVHPWETGRDNAPDWDAALEPIPVLDVDDQRDDTRWVGVDQRPQHRDYGRYAYLVMELRAGEPPSFRVFDPGVASILTAACNDLAWVAERLGDTTAASTAQNQAERAEERLKARADPSGLARAEDLTTGRRVATAGAGWALNVLRPSLDDTALDRLEHACLHDEDALAAPYGVRSWPRADDRFDARRYWRGPVWASITWLCALGFERHGRRGTAVALRERLAAAVDAAGHREFVDGDTGEGLGAHGFTWTAALDAWCSAHR